MPRSTQTARRVRLFRNGRNQALRIPRDLELPGDSALLHRDGDRLIVEPIRKGRLLELLAKLEPLPDAFPDVDSGLAALDDVPLRR
jgi:antitoxin VapB